MIVSRRGLKHWLKLNVWILKSYYNQLRQVCHNKPPQNILVTTYTTNKRIKPNRKYIRTLRQNIALARLRDACRNTTVLN